MKKIVFIWLFLLPLWLSAQELWCPEPTNRLVNDYSGVLSSQERIALEERLVAFDDSTSNQILVIILPSLHDCEIMELGTRIGTTWGVGQKDLKNVPGYGLEGALPDAFCKHIIDDEMISPLSEGDYYQAICNALEVIEPVCRGEYSYEQYKREDRRALFVMLGVMLLLAVVCFVLGDRYNKKHPHDHDNFTDDDNSSHHRNNGGGWTYWGGIPRSGGFGGFGGGSSGGFGGFGGGSFGGGGAHGRF